MAASSTDLATVRPMRRPIATCWSMAPLFSMMWNALARRGLEPSIPIKFGVALMGVGAGFLFLVWGTQFAGPDFKVTLWWLAGLYLIHSFAELCISPVGLSMITKLSI